MAVNMTDSQMKTVGCIIRLTQIFADNMRKIMKNKGLDQIDGCQLGMTIDPKTMTCDEIVTFGQSKKKDAGYVFTVRSSTGKGNGVHENDSWRVWMCESNSDEHVKLLSKQSEFGDCKEKRTGEKPLPPDGLWISNHDDCPFLDCGV